MNKPLREKKLAGPSTDRHASNPFAFNARSTFEYLIGQQRRQSMPQPVAKSRAKSKLLEVVLEQIELAIRRSKCDLNCPSRMLFGSR